MMRMKGWRKHAYHVMLWAIALIFFAPVLWIVLGAFKTADGILAIPPQFIFTPTLENFVDLTQRQNIGRYFRNSLVMSTASVGIAIGVSFLAAYAFSRFRPPGTNFMMFLLLSMRMVPAVAV
ncbi:MAG: carbohydrate ABC transporter permease, partial [Chloroflexota bacterium]